MYNNNIYEEIYTKLNKIFTLGKVVKNNLIKPNKNLENLLYTAYGLESHKYNQSFAMSAGTLSLILVEDGYDGYLKNCGLYEYSKTIPNTLIIFVDNVIADNLFMNLYNIIKTILFINDGIDYLNSPLASTIEGKTNTIAPILLTVKLLQSNCIDFSYEKVTEDIQKLKEVLPKEYNNMEELIKISLENDISSILVSGMVCEYIK